MKQKILKLFSVAVAIILCACCLSACAKDNGDANQSSSSVSGYYVDEQTGEIIDATTGKVTDNDNLVVDENSGDIIDKESGETVETKEESDKVKENVSSKPEKEEIKQEQNTKPQDDISSNNDNQSDKDESSKVATPSNPTEPPSTACKHTETKVVGKKDATCTKSGYSGDTYCKKCDALISKGSDIQATGHKNTEIRNQKEATNTTAGYTGDTYCKDCGAKIASGSTIPKLDNNNGKIEYILPDGTHVWVEDVEDVTGYYMALKTKDTTHLCLDAEKEILRLCNEERAKVGLQPLEWFEDAYYFTQIRANECFTKFSHTRPNGKKWSSVYFDAGVYMAGHFGENLYTSIGLSPEQAASRSVKSWMNSPGHKANILNKKYNRIAIAVVENGNEIMIVQNFFS